jgi:GTPase SAR1 family protein
VLFVSDQPIALQNGRHALRYLYEQHTKTNDPEEDVLRTTRLLVSRGLTVPDEGDTKDSEHHEGLLAAIRGWVKELSDGAEELTLLQPEIVARGPTDVQAFFKFSNTVLFRKKLCVVGPSQWGKTSFIQTMNNRKPTCVNTADRTVGIELSSWDFSWMHKNPMSPKLVEKQYNVSLWDFAGQNDYQSTHSLFFSRRTMYVLCVDLKAYADEMKKAGGVDAAVDSPEMHTFVLEHIFRWIRVICAREPESEFVFVGTKADLIGHDTDMIKNIATDLYQRVEDAEKDRVMNLNQEISKLEHEDQERKLKCGDNAAQSEEEVTKLQSLVNKPPRFLSTELLVVSSEEYVGIKEARDMLQRLIVESDTSFPMPKVYNEVRELLRGKVDEMKSKSSSDKIRKLFADAESLQNEIAGNIKFSKLSPNVIQAILHVLHDLGDVLWFDKANQLLSRIIFLSPKMVIDFIRELINHSITGTMRFNRNLRKLQQYIKDEGCVKHDLLVELGMWKTVSTVDSVDRPLMLQLKELLLHFNLAYPANQGGMKWDSDLMVPMYWRKYSSQHPSESCQPDTTIMKQSALWKYVFRYHLPENLFERYMAQSYSVFCPSQFFLSCNALDAISIDKWHVRVSIPDDFESEINIHVWAADRDEMWFQLERFVMSLEKLLDGYPGLWVTRNVIPENGRPQKLEDLLSAREESCKDKVRCEAQVVDVSERLLPTKMEWYTSKRWRERIDQSSSGSADGTELDKQMLTVESSKPLYARLNSMYDAVKNLREQLETAISNGNNMVAKLITGQLYRHYPALWTLEWKESAPTGQLVFELKLRSHLSGNCFHTPIELKVPNTFFVKYGVVIMVSFTHQTML